MCDHITELVDCLNCGNDWCLLVVRLSVLHRLECLCNSVRVDVDELPSVLGLSTLLGVGVGIRVGVNSVIGRIHDRLNVLQRFLGISADNRANYVGRVTIDDFIDSVDHVSDGLDLLLSRNILRLFRVLLVLFDLLGGFIDPLLDSLSALIDNILDLVSDCFEHILV